MVLTSVERDLANAGLNALGDTAAQRTGGGESHDDRSRTFRGAFSEHYDESKVLRSECVLLHLRLDPPDVKTFAFSCRS